MKRVIQKLKKIKRKYFLLYIFIAILVFRTIYACYMFNIKYKKVSIVKEVMVISLEKVKEDKVTYLVRYDKNNFLLNIYSRDKEKSIDESYTKFKYADKLRVNGNLSIPKLLNNPNEFNYKRYLNSKAIVGTISTYRVKKIGEKYGNPLLKVIYNFKYKVGEKIDSNFSKEKSGLLKSMIYGESISLDEEIKENLRINGMSHIVAVSGTNISYLLMIISFIFYEQTSSKERKRKLYISISIMCCFCIMASFSISILRATIMSSVYLLSKYFNIKLKKYTSIIISIIIIYLYNPYAIFSVSFIFSYLAVIGIVTFYNEVYSFFEVKIKKLLRYNYIEKSKIKIVIYNIVMSIGKVISMYISVQILTLPFQIYYFNQFSLTAIISNILISPFSLFVFFLGFLMLFLIFVPFISNILFNSLSLLLNMLITLSDFCTNFEMPINIPKPSITIILIYYIFIILFRISKKAILVVKRDKVKKVKFILNILVILYAIYVCIWYLNVMYFENYIYFFNVEQGNMAFIRYNRKNILIDCGSTTNNLSVNVLNNFCKEKNITNIDVLLVTHLHDDHINSIFSDNLDVNVERIIYSYPKEEIENLLKLEDFVNSNNVSLISSNIFDIYEYDNMKIYILSPSINDKVNSSDIQNSNSQVILLSIKENNYLFMGDATVETEEYLIQKLGSMDDEKLKNEILNKLKNIKVLQVGHHGSKTSTSNIFLSYINVKNAVISAKKERYGHPSDEVVKRLENKKIKLFFTEKNGAIKFKI